MTQLQVIFYLCRDSRGAFTSSPYLFMPEVETFIEERAALGRVLTGFLGTFLAGLAKLFVLSSYGSAGHLLDLWFLQGEDCVIGILTNRVPL